MKLFGRSIIIGLGGTIGAGIGVLGVVYTIGRFTEVIIRKTIATQTEAFIASATGEKE